MADPLLTVDLSRENPALSKYERLRDHLIAQMRSGQLVPGQMLPSEQSMVESLGVARTTVRQAMASLENEGLIRRVQGKGTFVDENVQRKLKHGHDIFALVVIETHTGFYPSLLRGFDTAADHVKHRTIVCSTDDNVERQGDIVLQLLDQKVGGVAINPTNYRPTPVYHIRQLQTNSVPVVFLFRRVEGIAAPVLAIPFAEVGRRAGEAFVERGHKRAACFTSQPTPASQLCEHGFHQAFRPGGRDTSIQWVHIEEGKAGEQEAAILATLQAMFASPNPPTAIFASFDSLAEMIYLCLTQLGLRVPQDVSLLGFGGSWRDGALMRRLSSIVIDAAAVGQQVVSLLHEMRCGSRPADDSTEIVLELGFHEGETLGKR